MPIYEYACAACGHTFEEWQKMSDAPVRTCPKCKKKKVEKLISHTAFQLKGGGWYADLYSSSKSGSQKTDVQETTSGSARESQASKDGKGGGNSGASEGGAKGVDSGAAAAKKESTGEAKDAKKKDSQKKSETRAA